jgi:uncharacterized membrane protein YdbT with pleckstrin-like domain
MPRWLVPYLLPLGIIVAVVIAVLATPVIALVVTVVLVFVVAPLAYREYRKTSDEERRAGRPGGSRWLN